MVLPPADIPAFLIAEDAIIYNTVAASAFTFWEHCITFSQEVDLIWSAEKWSLISILFMVMRYLIFCIRVVELVFYTNVFGLIRPTPSQCRAWLRFEAASGQLLFFCVELVLILRVVAYYGRSKRLLYGLFTLLVVESASRITILGITLPNTEASMIPSPFPPRIHTGACVVLSSPPLFANYWVPGLLFESVLFLLALYQFVQIKRHKDVLRSTVLTVFVRDGTWAFALMFGVLLWCTVSFEVTPIKGDIALTWLYTILAFCGTRVILNLRSLGVEQTGLTAEEFTELHFERYHMTVRGTTTSSGTGYTTTEPTGFSKA